MTLSMFLAYWSGLAFVAPPLPWSTLVGTVLILHTCDAVMCRLLAHNTGRPTTRWTLIGFVGGLWAVATLLLLPRPGSAAPSAP
jgi:hypothetical protein